MTVSDIYLVTKQDLVEIKDYDKTLYLGSCDDIPDEFMERIVGKLTHNALALQVFVV